MVWRIPGEWMLDRLDELYEYLENFPESALSVAVQHEIEYLESLVY